MGPLSSSARILRGLLVMYAVSSLACLSVEGRGRVSVIRKLGALELVNTSNCEESDVKRSDFPSDFSFGVSTAALQVEGSSRKGGRGPSVWDYFVEKYPDKIVDRSNFDTTIDSYNRYKEDVKHIEDLGVDVYRFSISWTRILPNGSLSGGINQKGIDHYNSLIDELIKKGIKPFVTLLHFDWPQALQDKYKGFLSRSIINDFKDYSEVCFKAFGDRVKNWATINEPQIIAQMGHDVGTAPPKRCTSPSPVANETCPAGNSATEPYIVTHNMLLAHAAVARLYKEKFQSQGGEIGITLVGTYHEPSNSKSLDDNAAAGRATDFSLGWYMEPLVFGDYPKSMKELVKERLPAFNEEEKQLVKGSFDFVGINYYTSRWAKSIPINPTGHPQCYTTDNSVLVTVNKSDVYIGPVAEGSGFIYIYPQGLEKLLELMKKKYQNPKIIITENGDTELNDKKRALDTALKDTHRIEYICLHLCRIRNAIKNGVNVKGYFYWSLFDDFEWCGGYTVRFGLYYIDYNDNLKRFPKESAKWYSAFLRGDKMQAS